MSSDAAKVSCLSSVVELRSRLTNYAVLIPVLNEGETILAQLARMQAAKCPADVILSDGGSQDGSTELERLAGLGVRSLLVTSERGLGRRCGMGFVMRWSKVMRE